MHIVVTDGYTLNPGDNPWDEIAALGRLTVYDRTDPDRLMARISDADILIVNKTPVRRDALTRLDRLKFITVSATGYDIVDIDDARERGIPVSNIPIYGDRNRGAVCLCPGAGTGAPARPARRGRQAWGVGRPAGLELLEKAADGAGRKDHGDHRLRADRPAGG